MPVADAGCMPEAKRPACGGPAFGVPACMPSWPQPAPLMSMPSAMPCDPRMMAGFSTFPQALPTAAPVPMAPTAPSSDLTREIMDALRNRSTARTAAVPPQAPQASQAAAGADTPELGSMLLNSLRTLMPNGQAFQSSGASQELFRVVQNMSASQPAPAPAEPAPDPAPAAVPDPVEPPQDVPSAEAHRGLDADRPPPVHLGGTKVDGDGDDDAESDDGVPHRLPPGFGAIPEDIVEERARQREEQRILQLKATQPCRFGKRCKKRDCPNAHPEGRDIDTAWNPCAFGRRCKRKGCFYDHPEGREIDDNPEKGMCKFGVRCSRPDCLYDHPEGRAAVTGADPRICYFCHDPGHIAGDCPRNPESWNFNREVPGQVVQVSGQRAITT